MGARLQSGLWRGGCLSEVAQKSPVGTVNSSNSCVGHAVQPTQLWEHPSVAASSAGLCGLETTGEGGDHGGRQGGNRMNIEDVAHWACWVLISGPPPPSPGSGKGNPLDVPCQVQGDVPCQVQGDVPCQVQGV